ncbi:MAG: ATP-binding protein [Bacteroidetes bacterium]|nr:ATP-binding protein [Bacteroidota bacterium]
MKRLAWILILCSPIALKAQSHTLEKLWETDSIVATPESVHPNPSNKSQLYITLIDGGPWEDDKKGGVGLLDTDGTHYVGNWTTGLSAPKGMGIIGDRLYVADISNVIVIDRNSGAILKKLEIEDGENLNDITVDASGIVYVSDSKTGKIYSIQNDVPSLYMEGMQGVNGLKASAKGLYILAKKSVLLADAGKNITKITDLPNGGDGVEEVGNGDLLVSEWLGNVFYVKANGEKEQLLDRKAEKKNTADIWYVQSTQTLYVPGFFGKTITAYRLVTKKN